MRPQVIAIAIAALLGIGGPVTAQTAPLQTENRILVLKQDGDTGALEGTISQPLNTSGNRQTSSASAQIADEEIASLNALNIYTQTTTFDSDSEAVNAVGWWLKERIGKVTSLMRDLMRRHGVHTGLFTYRVKADISGESKTLRGTYLVRGNQDARFMGVKVDSSLEKILYFVYYQSEPASGLPEDYETLLPDGNGGTQESSWLAAHAGDYQWSLLEMNLSGSSQDVEQVPVDGQLWHTVETDGYYDSPRIIEAGTYTDDGVARNSWIENCAMQAEACEVHDPGNTVPLYQGGEEVPFQKNTGLHAFIDNEVVPRLKEDNYPMAMVDYQRKVRPVFNERDDGTMVAEAAVSVNDRTLEIRKGYEYFIAPAITGTTYKQSGQIGYKLAFQMDRYTVKQDGTAAKVGEQVQEGISPTETFSNSRDVSGMAESWVTRRIINPLPTDARMYDWRLDNEDNPLDPGAYIHVAPIRKIEVIE